MYLQSVALLILVALVLLLAAGYGKYMAAVYQEKQTWFDFLKPVEKFIFRISGIDSSKSMNWKQYSLALIAINLIWWLMGFLLLVFQARLPLNPAGNPSMSWDLAFNSSVSFLTSTNLQHYSGESGATYFTQIGVFTFLQFVSAATSLAAGVAIVRGFVKQSGEGIGNFFNDLLLSVTRVLLPLCILAAVLLLFCGVPMNFNKPATITTLQGEHVTVANGPVAAMLPIKELGSNGGGFFGANDAHPFENPNLFSFIIHIVMVLLLPASFLFMVGFYLDEKKLAWMIIGIMLIGLAILTVPIMLGEIRGNSEQQKLGINISQGNMEGKETRLGSTLSSFYAGLNIAVPAGTTVSAHDSYMPTAGIYMLLGMQIDAFFGGVGSGWINMLIFLIIAIFIGSLMIGRTPELFGRKVTMRQIQAAMIIFLFQPLVCLGLTGVTISVFQYIFHGNANLNWFSNNGPHNFTTALYEFTSSYAGNGSGFESLGDNTIFWNLTTAFAMLCGRFIPIFGGLYIAGLMRHQIYTPASAGTLKTDTVSFGVLLFFVIVVLQSLSMFSCFVLGPINEHLHMIH
ncbi:potassium-transporting ATPase subunit KdpA [uncultured Mucilaginibacter sp.]|uniref:potassium-transporting ATPase subunit KdpA n=1 Tax=uncultured Mucilaginibacter sp. TaxID=797541 RepID=UPI00260E2E93|nr:potassium-transporting ATPase subunit KdpA [uncultured Mucilaginibacter sp.]